jgi:hypothetical protein
MLKPQGIQLPDGSLYIGEMQNNVPHGKGKVEYKQPDEWNRLSYDGDWVDGKRQGYGILTWATENRRYEGQWKDDYKDQGTESWTQSVALGNGYSARVYQRQCEFTGTFKNDKWCDGVKKEDGKVVSNWKNGKYQENCIIS